MTVVQLFFQGKRRSVQLANSNLSIRQFLNLVGCNKRYVHVYVNQKRISAWSVLNLKDNDKIVISEQKITSSFTSVSPIHSELAVRSRSRDKKNKLPPIRSIKTKRIVDPDEKFQTLLKRIVKKNQARQVRNQLTPLQDIITQRSSIQPTQNITQLSIQPDPASIQLDSESIQHDSESIQHDSESIQHVQHVQVSHQPASQPVLQPVLQPVVHQPASQPVLQPVSHQPASHQPAQPVSHYPKSFSSPNPQNSDQIALNILQRGQQQQEEGQIH